MFTMMLIIYSFLCHVFMFFLLYHSIFAINIALEYFCANSELVQSKLGMQDAWRI